MSVSDLKASTEYRAINLKDAKTQEAIMSFDGDFAEELHKGDLSFHYGDKGEVDGLMEAFDVE